MPLCLYHWFIFFSTSFTVGLDNVDIEETYSEEDIDLLNKGVRRQVNKVLKERTYNWQPVDYTEHISRVYLWSRFVPDYAVLVKVLEEIYKQLPDFKPHSVFDFGSGIGTAIWLVYFFSSLQIWLNKHVLLLLHTLFLFFYQLSYINSGPDFDKIWQICSTHVLNHLPLNVTSKLPNLKNLFAILLQGNPLLLAQKHRRILLCGHLRSYARSQLSTLTGWTTKQATLYLTCGV